MSKERCLKQVMDGIDGALKFGTTVELSWKDILTLHGAIKLASQSGEAGALLRLFAANNATPEEMTAIIEELEGRLASTGAKPEAIVLPRLQYRGLPVYLGDVPFTIVSVSPIEVCARAGTKLVPLSLTNELQGGEDVKGTGPKH